MNRLDTLRNLVTFNMSIDVLSDNLAKFDWDYKDIPLIITSKQIKSVLKRFLNGEYSSDELERWANLIEGRDDLEFDKSKQEEMEKIVFCLANPELEGEITLNLCREFLTALD